jgi:hypothetical protein
VTKFPVDAPKSKVVKALGLLGFRVVREREHVALARDNADGTQTPLTLPNHPHLKEFNFTHHCTQAGIPRDEFLKAYEKS